ncbi:MAG: L-threonylcarbamoyladenylate synthase [Vulcanimicrobiota bacterium]
MSRTPRRDSKRRQVDTQEAEKVLRSGGLVAFPTEFGYRLAGSARRPETIARLRERTGRQSSRPLILTMGGLEQAEEFAEVSQSAEALWEIFAPGPLVTLLARRPEVDPAISHTLKVGVHFPSHPLARQLLRDFEPLVSSGVRARELADYVLEAQDPPLELVATVVDATSHPVRLIESGFISTRELEFALGHRPLLSGDEACPRRFTRFRPEVTILAVVGDPQRTARRLRNLRDSFRLSQSVRMLVSTELAEEHFADESGVIRLGSRNRPEEFEAQLFLQLGDLERQTSGVALIEGLAGSPSVMERLEQLAQQVINTDNPGYSGIGVEESASQ